MRNNDLISRAAAIAEVEQWAEHGYEGIHWTGIKAMLENQPTVDAVQVVHGRWVNRKTWDKAVCSNCSFENAEMTKFCPNCGAKMDGGETDG